MREGDYVNPPLVRQQLPVAAPARVLACGAWLKNTACLLDGDAVWLSPLHGDLGTPEARASLLESVAHLQQQASGPIEAVAHDLHPDFFSTEVAQQLAQKLGVPTIAVQHHHAHIAQVQAQQAPGQALLGWALDGVGLGSDQTAWGGELLRVQDGCFERLNHLPTLLLPGGDVAAREPWRVAVAALHRLGSSARASSDSPAPVGLGHPTTSDPAHARVNRSFGGGTPTTDTIFSPWASTQLHAGRVATLPATSIQGVANMLVRGLNCPATTSAGRWFDAVAGLLGVCWWQTEEAQAAIALEQLAAQWLGENPAPVLQAELLAAGLNLDVLLRQLLARMAAVPADAHAYRAAQAQAAALFHVALADALARTAIQAAQAQQISAIALSGGCFYNRILRTRLQDSLSQAGLTVLLPQDQSIACGPGATADRSHREFGDAGLALGQAWVAAHRVRSLSNSTSNRHTTRNSLCA